MFFIIDLLALLIFFGTVVSCYRKGFFKSFFSSIRVVLAIIVSYMFMPTVSYLYRTKFVQDAVSGVIEGRLFALVQETADNFNLEKLFLDMPAEFSDILSRFGTDAEKLSESYGQMSSAASSNVTQMAQTIAFPVAKTISDVLAYVTLFIGTMIILTIVIKIIGVVLKLPVLSGFDKILGLALGVVSGGLFLWVYCNVVSIGIKILNTVKPDVLGSNVIENTYIVRYLSDWFGAGFF